MAKCAKCKKSCILTYLHTDGKRYCSKCYDTTLAKEKKEKKKQKEIKSAKKAMDLAYYRDKRKLVVHLINSWKPKNCTAEGQYQISLKKYLEKELTSDDIYVGTEHGLGMSRLDLVVGKKKPYRDIAIEIKYNLNNSSHFDRLKGQIHTYVTAKFKHIIILLAGKTESKLETELKKYFKEMEQHYRPIHGFGFSSIELIKKK